MATIAAQVEIGLAGLFLMRNLKIIFVLLALAAAHAGAQERERLSFDRSQLERTEDHSESLANDLLDLSVALRRQDLSKVADYFTEEIDAQVFPSQAGPLVAEVKWLTRRTWNLSNTPERVHQERFKDGLQAFFANFSEIEDFRLKVKQADFESGPPVRGRAKIFCFLVGRNKDGQREWVRGTIQAQAQLHGRGPWQFTHWNIESLSSMVATTDLFSEITAPAGLWEDAPAFGEPPNDGFVAHGAAVADINEDGFMDLLTSGVTGSRLYLNNGDGRFQDISEETLVRYARDGTGALFVDYDNDGDPDIFLAAVGNQILLQNQYRPDGELFFIDVSGPAGIEHPAVGFSAVAADVNRDGWMDIYVASYNRYGQVMPNAWGKATNGTPNLLFMNQGDGRFHEASREWGVDDARWSYAAAFADVNNDGLQDLYVANDFGENALFINHGDRFRDEALERGVIDPGNGMGVSFGDYDNDGWEDEFSVNGFVSGKTMKDT
jgi:hypothetical protein